MVVDDHVVDDNCIGHSIDDIVVNHMVVQTVPLHYERVGFDDRHPVD